MVHLRYWRPPEGLTPFVRSFYHVELTDPSSTLTDTLITELANIRVLVRGGVRFFQEQGDQPRGPGSYVSGPTSRPISVALDAPLIMVGAGLTAAGWAAMFDAPASAIANQTVPLACLLPNGPDPADARAGATEDALQDFIAARIAQRRHLVPAVLAQIDRHLADPDLMHVDDLAALSGLSVRQLERITARCHGFAPKLLMRRQRFQEALDALRRTPGLSWQDAAGLAYYDQSHFIRDFKRFTGYSPHRYFAQASPLMRPALNWRDAALQRDPPRVGLGVPAIAREPAGLGTLTSG
jgi:AraC-like DNA-binding protein